MNNDEIRLSILSQYYRAAFNGKGYGREEENPELEGIPDAIINANTIYLIDKRLINGDKRYIGSGPIASPSDITAWGMDVVENIMNKSLNEMNNKVSKEIEKTDSTAGKFSKFYEKCIKVAPMCETAVKAAHLIFSSL